MISRIVLESYVVAPNAAGAVVGKLTALGADGPPVFALSDDPSGLFEISGATLRLKHGISMPPGSHFWADLTISACAAGETRAQDLRVVRDDFLTNGVVAHRGAHRHGRGSRNSMTAFRDAMAKGHGGFECDVLWSKDREVLVAHGPNSGSEDGTGDYEITKTPWSTLRKVYLGNGDYISLLGDVLDEVMLQNRTRIFIEIKNPGSKGSAVALAEKVVDVVTEHRAQAWVCYISFLHPVLRAILKRDPSSRCAPLGDKPGLPAEYIAQGMWGVDFRHDKYGGKGKAIVDFKSAGLDVNLYTVNHRADMLKYIEQGADRITTDEPERLLSIWESVVPGTYH